jgi:N-acetylmuramoyl-L-alanine amidase
MVYKKSYSPNYEARLSDKNIEFIILHYTDTKDAQEALDILCDADKKVSSHYLVDVDGTIIRLVDESHRAWHAGVSYWSGEHDLNSCSIGIEIVNPGHKYGYKAFPEKQMESVLSLCIDIKKRYGIKDHNILGHSDIAPDRKIDPGEYFDWKFLADNGVGVWPNPVAEDFNNATRIINEPDSLKKELESYGYNSQLDLEILIEAFQRHFFQEVFKNQENVGVVDKELVARLKSLNRIKNNFSV